MPVQANYGTPRRPLAYSETVGGVVGGVGGAGPGAGVSQARSSRGGRVK
jgi:hypothetical protein